MQQGRGMGEITWWERQWAPRGDLQWGGTQEKSMMCSLGRGQGRLHSLSVCYLLPNYLPSPSALAPAGLGAAATTTSTWQGWAQARATATDCPGDGARAARR